MVSRDRRMPMILKEMTVKGDASFCYCAYVLWILGLALDIRVS